MPTPLTNPRTNLPEFIPSEPNSKLHPMPTSSPNPVKEPTPPPLPRSQPVSPRRSPPSTRPRAPAPQVTPVETSSLSPFPPQPSITGFLPRPPPTLHAPRLHVQRNSSHPDRRPRKKKSWKDRPSSVMYETAFQTIIVPHISPNRSPGSPNLPSTFRVHPSQVPHRFFPPTPPAFRRNGTDNSTSYTAWKPHASDNVPAPPHTKQAVRQLASSREQVP